MVPVIASAVHSCVRECQEVWNHFVDQVRGDLGHPFAVATRAHAANFATECDEGGACTGLDICQNGLCKGTAIPACQDGNVCTDDTCLPAQGCVHMANAATCQDGNVCTVADACAGGQCVGGPPPDCQDANPCTKDLCAAGQGCAHLALAGACDDGDACTFQDGCVGLACVGKALACQDGNVCTADVCQGGKGCLHPPTSGPCNDGDPCTTGDICATGKCAGGNAVNCDDNNVCTTDSCNSKVGCNHANNGAACDDGVPCTVDTCEAAKGCVHVAHANLLLLDSEIGDWVGKGKKQVFTKPTATFSLWTNSAGGASVSVNTGKSWSVDLAAPYKMPLEVKTYTGAARYPFMAFTQPGLSVSGDGSGCNQLTGSFQVLAVTYDTAKSIVSLVATFEQYCDFSKSLLKGAICVGAPVPPQP